MEWSRRSYQCSVCSDLEFKSRSDWLVHLVLSPHSSRVVQNFEKWKTKCEGDLYVIYGLDNVENSMLLEYLTDNIQTFGDIVFFKHCKVNICIVVGNAREIDAFVAKQEHYVGRVPIKFKPYKSISAAEWKSYFPEQSQNDNPENAKHASIGSVSLKRKLDEPAPCSSSKSIKLSQNPREPVSVSPHSGSSGYPSHYIDTDGSNWEEDLNKLQNYIFMSNTQIESRKSIIKHLTDLFRKSHPNCKVIPVGADILGFNLDQTIFTLYFDCKGFTEAENAKPHCVISETSADVDRIRTSLFVKLKSLQTEGILSNVQCQGANCIRFKHELFDLQCNLLLRPFMVAQTARLCTQLYSMDERVASLLNMVTYWAMQHQHFFEVGLTNPYVLYWLVYFFFMKKQVLPPVAELQKSCPYEIVDRHDNVAFSYDESAFANVISPHRCKVENPKSQIEMLLEWFTFMDDAFGEAHGKGENRRHSLVCLRFGQLVDKRKFTVCWEAFRDKKKTLTSKQKKVRKLWKENLIELGFEEAMWGNLLGLKMPDTLCVQHPLYISENISLAFEGPFSKRFFKAVKETREKLSQLLVGNNAPSSLLLCLSDFGP